ncbi:MAG TPA: HAMP domain-containing sensor histidine kinase, partial [Nitrososphaeraceae archaeon]|nr:HAMP domain-containing sensor histidine kinase [Nitrososphaeraceae archaeon]
SEIMRPKVNSEDQVYVDVIVRNAKRLQRLTEEILDVTKIESQSLRIEMEEFNLKDVIVNCINDVILDKHLTNNEKDKPKILYEPNDVLLKADKNRISQVVSNLVSNAIKFSSGGAISVQTSVYGNDKNNNNEIVVSIKDNGQGIDPEILPRLFSKFATKSYSGTGLGLFICKSIVEAHGGSIWAENNSDGKGATFSFTLPLSKISTQVGIGGREIK